MIHFSRNGVLVADNEMIINSPVMPIGEFKEHKNGVKSEIDTRATKAEMPTFIDMIKLLFSCNKIEGYPFHRIKLIFKEPVCFFA